MDQGSFNNPVSNLYKLPQASEEQQEILHAIQDGHNVMVDAVAGSGKTTSILYLAQQCPALKFFVFTYNARLKAETRQRVKFLNLTNIEVHSYHSFGLKYYTEPCMNDTHLLNIVKNNTPIRQALHADVVVLDEAQDMTYPYYCFIRKCLSDMNKNKAQLVVLGDHMQCIYDFPQKGADHRFLTLAPLIWKNKREWKKLHLRTSYRLTKNMEYFVNEAVLGYPRMNTIKEVDIPVQYISGDIFDKIPTFIVNEVQTLLQSYKPEDIFILAPSIRSKNPINPIKKIENELVQKGISCYVPTSDEEELCEEVLYKKLVFSSFHQSKGLERKVVIVFNFCNSYFQFYSPTSDRFVCPNTLYVAITRAKERLYAISDGDHLRFLKHHKLSHPFVNHITLKGRRKTRSSSDSSGSDSDVIRNRRVTELTRFLPEELIDQILELAKMTSVKPKWTNIDIPHFISTDDGKTEAVSELNGIAIPTMFENNFTKTCSIQDDLQSHFTINLKQDSPLYPYRNIIWKNCTTPSDYLQLANLYNAYVSGYIFKLEQIRNYEWLHQEQVTQLLDVLHTTIGDIHTDSKFEHTLEYEYETKGLLIGGRCDLLDPNILWELKCVEEIRSEHIIQLALYAWLYMKQEYEEHGMRKFMLHNIRTGEVMELTGVENLQYIADIIIDNHLRNGHKMEDDEFIRMCKKKVPTKQIVRQPEFMFILDE
jgi:hypothetical protein